MKRYDTNEAASSQLLIHFLQHDALNGIIFTFVSLLKHIFPFAKLACYETHLTADSNPDISYRSDRNIHFLLPEPRQGP